MGITQSSRACTRCGHDTQKRPSLGERVNRLRGERVRRRCLAPTSAGRCPCMEPFHEGR